LRSCLGDALREKEGGLGGDSRQGTLCSKDGEFFNSMKKGRERVFERKRESEGEGKPAAASDDDGEDEFVMNALRRESR
jgi:hypothetical protein